ncbi:hypothetical protein K490DRAFT_67513 [Saccharata proteae CBS 121410]|uniref:Telomere length regulation protein conserved domain-containing protein n=1 Tax=Saccharata proteae CBS 121410 TaxID=1314787 RepID=A0A9P4HPS4_9PEZI|nr:hypothetical protein K490DRAFT_67513 [Saccharata proteae CBS 121410]
MADFLTAVKTTKVKAIDLPVRATQIQQPQSLAGITIGTPGEALKVLREQPNISALRSVLKYLSSANTSQDGINVNYPSPVAAQIVGTLVNTIIPDYWQSLVSADEHSQDVHLLLNCVKNISGLGAIIARLRTLMQDAQLQNRHGNKKEIVFEQIKDLLTVLERLMRDSTFVYELWRGIDMPASAPTQHKLLWREFIALTASGRILSVAAHAESFLKDANIPISDTWLTRGTAYSQWSGRNVASFVRKIAVLTQESNTAWADAAAYLGKCFTLGYNSNLVGELLSAFIEQNLGTEDALQKLLERLQPHEKRQFLNVTLDMISREYLRTSNSSPNDLLKPSKEIAGSSALLTAITMGNGGLRDYMVQWLTNVATTGASGTLSVRRAALSSLRDDEDKMVQVLERSLEQFGDELFIKHTPILSQEAMAQVLLISCGYLHRSQPMLLFTLARSSTQTRGMSNRVAASSPRARFLGMVVGMAMSDLVDKPDNRLKFEFDESEDADARWFMQLTKIDDKIGSISNIRHTSTQATESMPIRPSASKKMQNEHTKSNPQPPAVGGPRIIEILDESDSDDDLVPYSKPDSDPEDDSEDPTLVQRNKPTAPVYIRDLLSGLRDTENYDRHQLALSTAAGLIRRKSTFGKEVTDNIEELASALVGLNDQFELENFQEMRQKALIAVLLAQPRLMGQWLARSFFSGDFSISQRVTMLTTMGLGARELAGFKNEDDEATAAKDAFPSKRLPKRLQQFYATDTSPLDSISGRLRQNMLSPLALDAADKLSGPNALKVRTFSSRMEVEKKRKKPIANELAKIVAQNFFFPLTAGWIAHSQALGNTNIYYSPQILPTYLKTLAILIHASGPSTLSLPQMTSELWDLLLSLRTTALSDPVVLEALLFAFLTLLEINEDQHRLVQEHSKELLETHEWVKMVFERLGGGDKEGERARMLAAGVLVRCGEVVEKYQRALMGDMMDF